MEKNRIQVLLYTQQPFVGRGFAAVLRGRPGFQLVACCENLADARKRARLVPPHIVLIHVMSRISLSDLREFRASYSRSQIVLWGDGMVGEFAFQAMQLGIRGILPGTTSIECLLSALRSVNRGVLCFEKELMDTVLMQNRVNLTERQGQIISLVAQGLKNKEIAWSLGITEGTVKVYLYKLFRKLGMNDRLAMALYGQKNLFSGQGEADRTWDFGRRPRHALDMFVPRSLDRACASPIASKRLN